MIWESPAALLLGLALPAIVALWLLRPRRPRLRVPSLLLWPGSPAQRQASRPWQRLRNHPLLWLQLAAAALLALTAARPYVPAGPAGQHLVIFLDASGSMRARDPSASTGSGQPVAPDRFGAAVAAVRDLARGLGSGQEMTVIRLDEQPRVLVAGARSAAEVERALRGEVASFGPPDGAAAAALAEGLAAGPAQWALVGDGGATVPNDAGRPTSSTFRFLPIGRSGEPAGNVAISGLSVRQTDTGRVAVQAGVRNLGAAPVAGRLQLLAEGQLVGAREWQAGPGEETYLSWSDLPLDGVFATRVPRWFEARLAGVDPAANLLEHDDRAWAALAAASSPRVLLVTPGNTFLERVFAVQAGLRVFRAAPADWPALAAGTAAGVPATGGAEAGPYPLTVFDRYWPERRPAGSALLVGPPVGAEFHPSQVWLTPSHPLLRHVDWSDVRIATAHQVPLDDTWQTVIDSDGGPLLAIRTEGERREALLAFDLSQSDLALRPAYPILMANLLDWLLPRPDDAPRVVAPGAAVSVEPAPLARQAWAEPVDGSSQFSAPGSGRIALAPPWPPLPFRPPAPGVYRIVQDGEGGRHETLVVAEGYDPAEAALAVRTPTADGGRPSVDGGSNPATAFGVRALWLWLGALVLAVSAVEWWVDARGR